MLLVDSIAVDTVLQAAPSSVTASSALLTMVLGILLEMFANEDFHTHQVFLKAFPSILSRSVNDESATHTPNVASVYLCYIRL